MDQPGKQFRVQITTGEIKRLTLEELDAAYQAGTIDDDTFVLCEGSTQWMKLDEMLASATTTEVPAVGNNATSLAPPPVVTDLASLEDIHVDVDDFDVDSALFGKKPRSPARWVAAGALLLTIGGGSALYAAKGWKKAEPQQASVETKREPAVTIVAAAAPPAALPAPPPSQPPAPEASADAKPAASAKVEPAAAKGKAGSGKEAKAKKAGGKKARPTGKKKDGTSPARPERGRNQGTHKRTESTPLTGM